jgi:transformation/transcription domain-associated protein
MSYVAADVRIVRRHGSSHRRIALVGTDGRTQYFLVQTSLTPAARSDERMVQLMRHLNRLLLKHKQSRRRHLLFHTPIIVPVWPQVRLLEEELSYSTYGEAYEMYHARHGREADVPINFFKESLNKAFQSEMPPQKVWDLRLSTYRDIITSNYVIDTVFKHYMIKLLPTENLWMFKRQFMAQMALSSFMSAVFHIGGRQPQKILFAKSSGKVLQLDFHPMYDAAGNLEAAEAVPFRLTRNLQSFFTPYGIEGSLVACMGATSQAFTATHSPLEHHLTMFFRDELMTWPWRRQGASGQPPPRRPELVVMVQANVKEVLSKVHSLKPEPPPAGNAELRKRAVQEGVLNLVESALNPRNICRMEPTWHPWF